MTKTYVIPEALMQRLLAHIGDHPQPMELHAALVAAPTVDMREAVAKAWFDGACAYDSDQDTPMSDMREEGREYAELRYPL